MKIRNLVVWMMLAIPLLAFGDQTPPNIDKPVVKVTKADTKKTRDVNESELQTHSHYKNKSGTEVHSPSKSKTGVAPAGASAKCGDGSYSFSQSRRGTCSHHGGVGKWL